MYLVDLMFFAVYAVQKSHFYLNYESYSHHLFNPVNMLLIVSYLGLLMVLEFGAVENKYIEV